MPILALDNCAIATSGDTSQFVDINGTRYSHILNSITGYGLKNLLQVTVIAENGMIADSLATACSVLGPTRAKKLLNKEDFKAFFIIQKSEMEVLEIFE